MTVRTFVAAVFALALAVPAHAQTTLRDSLGALLGGLLGESIGIRATIALGGALSTLAFVPLLFGPVPAVRAMPTGPDDAQWLGASRSTD